jgi:2-methylcitrate dehydratase (2-methyl-trans-aconitate forming)
MCPEYGATAAMFYIDQQTIDYLKLTGREPSRWRWSRTTPSSTGLWADALVSAEYERVLNSICPAWCATWLAPSNPHKRLPTSALHERGIADEATGGWQN